MRTKKIVSLILAAIMLFSVCSVASFAWEDGQIAKITVETDKTAVQPGDTVTVTLSTQWNSASEFDKFQNGMFGVMYNNAQLTLNTASNTWHNTVEDFATIRAASSISAATQINKVLAGATEAEKALIDEAGLNAFTKHQIMKDANTLYGAQGYWEMNEEKEAFCTFEFTVSDTVSDGDKITLAVPSSLFYTAADKTGAKQYYWATYDDSTSKAAAQYEGSCYDLSDTTVVLTVGSDLPVVAKNKAEVRFTYDTATDNGVADEFKLRIKSVVTAADWDAYFANTEDDAATTNKITAVGMVAFPTNEEFVEETALAAISAGASANYKAAKTDYIQKASNDSDAYFGAIINIKHSTCADGLNYIGFVQYLDASGAEQVIFYEAGAEFANVGSANYDTLVNTFKTQYPA